ncbi:hypothetical protein ABZ914_03115 [Spirillospora sp. NPDC046719]
MRTMICIPPETEQNTFTAAKLFAAIYPDAINIAELIASPTWRELAAGDDDQLSLFCAAIGDRIGVPDYQPQHNLDPIGHWIAEDCWQAPSSPPPPSPQPQATAGPATSQPPKPDASVTIRPSFGSPANAAPEASSCTPHRPPHRHPRVVHPDGTVRRSDLPEPADHSAFLDAIPRNSKVIRTEPRHKIFVRTIRG